MSSLYNKRSADPQTRSSQHRSIALPIMLLLMWANALLCLSYGSGLNFSIKYHFACHTGLMIALAYMSGAPGAYLSSPTIIALAYVCLSLFIGLWGLEQNIGLTFINSLPKSRALIWAHYREIAFFTLFSASLAQAVTERIRRANCARIVGLRNFSQFSLEQMRARQLYFFIGAWALLAVSMRLCALIDNPIMQLIAALDFVPIYFTAYALSVVVADRALLIRLVVYVAVLLSFALISYGNKRELLNLIIGLGLLELFHGKLNLARIGWRQAIYGMTALLVIFYLVCVMSILRGYGNFPINRPLDALQYVPAYVASPQFWDNILQNFEVTIFAHMHFESLEFIFQHPSYTLYGESYIKPVFLFFPDWLIGWKPTSVIRSWTIVRAPEFYAAGGSLPVSFISGAYWNFGMVGIIVIALVCYLFEIAYSRSLRRYTSGSPFSLFFWLFLSQQLFVFARGGGLELIFLYALFALALGAISQHVFPARHYRRLAR